MFYIDFADPNNTFNYQQCRDVISIGARRPDAPEPVSEPQPAVVLEKAAAAKAAPNRRSIQL